MVYKSMYMKKKEKYLRENKRVHMSQNMPI